MQQDTIHITETRYERLGQISWWEQSRLREAKVLVAGAGALGNEILKNLALVGVGNIMIADFDTVEISNLSRSILFRDMDCGKPKAHVAAEQLRSINSDLYVLPVQGDLRWDIGLGVYRRMDVVVAGLDSLGARVYLNEMCWKANTPWIDGALDELRGIMRVFIPPDNACFECHLSESDYQQLNVRYSCQLLKHDDIAEGHTPTTPTIASVIAAWEVQEAIKLIHGIPVKPAQGICYDGSTHNFFIVNYQRRETCLAHDTLEDIIPLNKVSSTHTVEELLDILYAYFGEEVSIELDREIVYGMKCPICRISTDILQPHFRLTHRDSLCPGCGNERHLRLTHCLDRQTPFMKVCLSEIGIPLLHILNVKSGNGNIWHVELTGDLNNELLAEFFQGEHV